MKNIWIIAGTTAFLLGGPALAQSGGAMGAAASSDGKNGWGQLPANATCSQMKQRFSAVQGSPAPTPGAASNNATPNNSGNTNRTEMARHEIAAGDSACEKGDRAMARQHYQRAIDQLTASH